MHRRYDLDWLRVLAFGLLIFYHIGMFYVAEWGWHVKSAYLSDPLQSVMLWSSQWRMSFIFLLSGMALSLVEPKLSSLRLLRVRALRIMIPLIFGMLIIVPPQLYFELKQFYGYQGGYAEFYSFYLDLDTARFPQKQFGDIGLVTWNHLWYLPYLFTYTLIYLLLKPVFVKGGQWLSGCKMPVYLWFAALVALLTVYGLVLKPHFPRTHNLVFDWYNHALSLTVFVTGYFIAKANQLWQAIIDHRRWWLMLGVVAYLVVLGFVDDWFSVPDETLWQRLPIQLIVYTNVVSWIFALLGYGGAYLNKPSRLLERLNEAVLPAYILHQTLIIMIGVWLSGFSLGGQLEPILLVIGTWVSTVLLYLIVERLAILRVLFGMKLKRNS
jgi:hypothetical protein